MGCLIHGKIPLRHLLMKIRESLTDNSKDGTVLTIPAGIYIYPNNAIFMVANSISLVLFLIALFLFVFIVSERSVDDDEYEEEEE